MTEYTCHAIGSVMEQRTASDQKEMCWLADIIIQESCALFHNTPNSMTRVLSHDQYNGGAKVTACFHNTEQIHMFYTFY